MAGERMVTGLLAAAVVLAACSPAESRGPQRIVGWSVDAMVLHLWVDTCNGDPETDVVETADDVTVTVVSTGGNPGDACQDPVTVTLTAPLGNRRLLDGSTGHEPEPMEG
jgi:hypothetical protein